MGSEFLVYLRLGFEHIADPRGYDHILFIVALTAMYLPRAWRQVVALVTAFTVGHSITLALATLGLIRVPTDLIEFLIPLTIFMTALLNGVELRRDRLNRPATAAAAQVEGPAERAEHASEPLGGQGIRYALALGFGLVHGLGFSNFLRAALGGEGSIVRPLFAFNVGLEAGQVLIVAIVLTTTAAATNLLRIPQRVWVITLSSAAGAMALYLLWERLPIG